MENGGGSEVSVPCQAEQAFPPRTRASFPSFRSFPLPTPPVMTAAVSQIDPFSRVRGPCLTMVCGWGGGGMGCSGERRRKRWGGKWGSIGENMRGRTGVCVWCRPPPVSAVVESLRRGTGRGGDGGGGAMKGTKPCCVRVITLFTSSVHSYFVSPLLLPPFYSRLTAQNFPTFTLSV